MPTVRPAPRSATKRWHKGWNWLGPRL
jgi:hypothetical protein